MTYSLDFRMQVLKSLDEGMTFAEAAEFYNLSPTTIQNWKRRVHSKTTRQTKPYKIPDDVPSPLRWMLRPRLPLMMGYKR